MISHNFLLSSLGYLASCLFFIRFFIQWISSEKKRVSHVKPSFWITSLCANVAMTAHGFIQCQFPIVLIQSTNALISLRNLDLMRPKRSVLTRKTLFLLMILMVLLLSFLFLLKENAVWMRSPYNQNISAFWHFFGFLGMLLFASRFWIQWWRAEKELESNLHPSFWKISLIGGLSSLLYSIKLIDPIQIIGFSLGLIPYARNLMLLKKHSPLCEKSFFLVAGEISGDLLGQNLVKELKEINPELNLEGVGGPLMASAGMKSIFPLEKLNVMGFGAVLLALPRLIVAFIKIRNAIIQKMPEKLILIDFQDFNRLLAKSLRKRGYRGQIIQYVSPTIWAWRHKRRFSLEKTHDLILSIFPFEKAYYADTSLRIEYVGHPLIHAINPMAIDTQWKKSQGFSDKILSLFPGSRLHEISHNLSSHLEAASQWIAAHPDFTLAISLAKEEFRPIIEKALKKENLNAILVPFQERYHLMRSTDLAIATSGTVTLELALHKVPSLVTYRVSSLNKFILKNIFKIKLSHFCIVNILAGREIYPEFYSTRWDSKNLVFLLERIFQKRGFYISQLEELRESMKCSITAAQAIFLG